MISVENYAHFDLIVKGSFAKVYKCRHKITGMAYAMKIVEKTKLSDESTKRM